jgi:hypothetical protein
MRIIRIKLAAWRRKPVALLVKTWTVLLDAEINRTIWIRFEVLPGADRPVID